MALVGSISGSAGLNIGITGSVIFSNRAGSNGSLFPSTLPGGDVYFFVSGSTAGKDSTAERTVALFGGDVAISGTLYGGSPLKIGDSVGLTGSLALKNVAAAPDAGASEAVLYSRAGTLYFKNAGGAETAVGSGGGGGGGTNFFYDTVGNGKIFTTASSVAFRSGQNIDEAADMGSDVVFYVSGSTAGGSVALFGGNVVASGTIKLGSSLLTDQATFNLVNTTASTINFAGDATTLTVGATSGNTTVRNNLTVTGDLTVNGTTTTVNTDNLLVKDAIIVMASGSAGPNKNGGIAIFSGSAGGGTPDLVFGRVANDVWGAGKESTANGTIGTLTGMTLVPIRAGEFQVAGASAYVSSSDNANLLVNSDTSTTFVNGGANSLVQIGAIGTTQGVIYGQSGTPGSSVISRLWVSGTRVDLAHSLTNANQGIGIIGNNTQGGLLRITKAGDIPTFNIEARDPNDSARSLIMSGSTVSVGASDTLGTVNFIKRQGTPHLVLTSDAAFNNTILTSAQDFEIKSTGDDIRFYGNSSNAFLNFVNVGDSALISGSANGNVTLGSSGTGTFTTISGSIVAANGGAGGLRIQRDGSNIGALIGVASTSLTLAAYAGTQGPGQGASTQLFLTGSEITLGSNVGGVVNFTRSGTAHLHLARNNLTSTISGALNQSVTLAAGTGATILTLSGSTIVANAGDGGFVFQKDGGSPELHINASGLTTTLSGSASQNITLASGLGTTTLIMSGSAVELNASAGSGVNFKKDGALFAIAGQTPDGITGLFPSSDSGASLGSPQRRWANVYTGDLHLRNDRGNWTIIEEEEYLSITNNISGKRYKFVLEEI